MPAGLRQKTPEKREAHKYHTTYRSCERLRCAPCREHLVSGVFAESEACPTPASLDHRGVLHSATPAPSLRPSPDRHYQFALPCRCSREIPPPFRNVLEVCETPPSP